MLDPAQLLDIKNVLLSLGELSKADILKLWGLGDAEYAALKLALQGERLLEPGPKGSGGFVVRVRRRALPPEEEGASAFTLQSAWERTGVERLAGLFSHAELEKLLGDLVYTVRRARTQMTGEDRRGTKHELAAALIIQHSIDLLANSEIRAAVARKAGAPHVQSWHPGKGSARRFVEVAGFPAEFAGIPSAEMAPDFEYLEGRVDLSPLQDFQLEVQKGMLGALGSRHGRAIVTLPTGGGKTRVAVDTLRDWLTARWVERTSADRHHTVLWLAHTEELCEQAYLCFKQVWQAATEVCPLQLFRFWGRYTQDLARHMDALFAMRERPTCLVSTPHRIVKLMMQDQDGESRAVRRVILEQTRALVVDEAHRAAAPSYRRILSQFEEAGSQAAVIGLTATPFRAAYVTASGAELAAGTRELKRIFARIVEPLRTLGEDPRLALQERGYLARPLWDEITTKTLLRPPPLSDPANLSEEDIEKIDYALKKRADNPARRQAILERILPICAEPDSKIIYFGPSVLDAECMALLLRLCGVTSAFVAGHTRDVTRRKIIENFKFGDIKVQCNCEVLTTGFDAPKVTHLIMARPTVSQVLYEQMVGRGLRGERFGGTRTCIILDCVDHYREARPALGYAAFCEIWKPQRLRDERECSP
jgi:superfamily II DNA or RNA helicase